MTDTETIREETPTAEKLHELYELIGGIETALMTTRTPQGGLVSRPMATQEATEADGIWFVTDIETGKVEDLKRDSSVGLSYYDEGSKEWVSVSGTATISQDRAKIRQLYAPDWKMWFGDEGGERDGGPDDPRLALIRVEPITAHYMKSAHSKPVVLFQLAKGFVTGDQPELGRMEELDRAELR